MPVRVTSPRCLTHEIIRHERVTPTKAEWINALLIIYLEFSPLTSLSLTFLLDSVPLLGLLAQDATDWVAWQKCIFLQFLEAGNPRWCQHVWFLSPGLADVTSHCVPQGCCSICVFGVLISSAGHQSVKCQPLGLAWRLSWRSQL